MIIANPEIRAPTPLIIVIIRVFVMLGLPGHIFPGREQNIHKRRCHTCRKSDEGK
jgi:hypothetical protein